MDSFDTVLGLGLRDWKPVAFDVPEHVRVLLGDRERARADKDWAQADRIRDALSAEGWRVEDTQEGQRLFGIAMGSTDTGSPPR